MTKDDVLLAFVAACALLGTALAQEATVMNNTYGKTVTPEAFAIEVTIKDPEKMHDWVLAQHAKRFGDVKISYDGEYREMSFAEFKRRVFQ
jgi:hypothetical protein